METVVINGTPRTELGKKATRALRKAGNIPCNLYGGKETLNFFAPETSFKRLIKIGRKSGRCWLKSFL